MTSKTTWPANDVQTWEIGRLKAYERNARTHSAEQIAKIAASIREFGFTSPILALEDGTIVAGHGRASAARLIGMGQVPVMVARGWSPEQIKAYVIADNQIALDAGWDEELLALEIGELHAAGFDLGLTGFDQDRIDDLLGLGVEEEKAPKVGLADRFGVAPFSVLNAREGWWQDRKRAWLALGIKSEVGRGENLLAFSDTINEPDPKKRAAKRKAA